MVKQAITAFNRASTDRCAVDVVFTAVDNRAFCTGGNTREYAEYYSGRPQEYDAYMVLFNQMVDAILNCDKPTICRVNGMRVAGGQEIGMACDFTIASDLARFGQAGPIHGSAPIGGSTDFLPLFLSIEDAMRSGVLCEQWSAYVMQLKGLITAAVPVLKVDGKFIPNPLVITDRWLEDGQIVYGETKTGQELKDGKELFRRADWDPTLLDEKVRETVNTLVNTFPFCEMKTIHELRKKKKIAWASNEDSHRDWLALNMMGEARQGFNAFNAASLGLTEEDRDSKINFVLLRQLLADGHEMNDELAMKVLPKLKAKE